MATFGHFNAGTNWGVPVSYGGGSQPVQQVQSPQVAQSQPRQSSQSNPLMPQSQNGSPPIDYGALLSTLPAIANLISGESVTPEGRNLSPAMENLLSVGATQAGKYAGLDPHVGGFIPAAVSLLAGNPEGALRSAASNGAGMLASELLPQSARGLTGPLASLAGSLVSGDSTGKMIENVGNSTIGALPGLLGITNPVVGLAYGAARMLGLNPMQKIGESSDSLRQIMYPDLVPGYEGGWMGKQGVGSGLTLSDGVNPLDLVTADGLATDGGNYGSPYDGYERTGLNLDNLNAPGLQIKIDRYGQEGVAAPFADSEGLNWTPNYTQFGDSGGGSGGSEAPGGLGTTIGRGVFGDFGSLVGQSQSQQGYAPFDPSSVVYKNPEDFTGYWQRPMGWGGGEPTWVSPEEQAQAYNTETYNKALADYQTNYNQWEDISTPYMIEDYNNYNTWNTDRNNAYAAVQGWYSNPENIAKMEQMSKYGLDWTPQQIPELAGLLGAYQTALNTPNPSHYDWANLPSLDATAADTAQSGFSSFPQVDSNQPFDYGDTFGTPFDSAFDNNDWNSNSFGGYGFGSF